MIHNRNDAHDSGEPHITCAASFFLKIGKGCLRLLLDAAHLRSGHWEGLVCIGWFGRHWMPQAAVRHLVLQRSRFLFHPYPMQFPDSFDEFVRRLLFRWRIS